MPALRPAPEGEAEDLGGGGVGAERLRSFFHPESLALVGATDHSRWSSYTYENWRTYGEGRPVYLVHPRHPTVHGCAAFKSLSEIDAPVDLAYVMVPTDQVLPVLEEAAEAGVRNAVVLTAGFAEQGPAGAALESQMVALASAHGMVVLGPNGNGFVNAAGRRVPYGLPIEPPLRAGPVGVVLQSGAMASVVMAMAQSRAIFPSLVVSTGNEAMIGLDDLLAYLVADEATRSIALFVEAVRDPQRFRAAASAALEAGKPVVALTAGRSRKGAEAARAHTGALVGEAAVLHCVLEDLGICVVQSLEALLATAGLAGSEARRLGRRLGVVGVSGGACELIADRAADESIELPEFPPSTAASLREVLPAQADPHNPLDVTGYVVVDPRILLRSLEAVARDASGVFDQILYQVNLPRTPPPDPEALLERYDRMRAILDGAPVPVLLQSSSGGQLDGFAADVVERLGFFVLDGVEHGMTAVAELCRWHERRPRRIARRNLSAAPQRVPPAGAGGVWGEVAARSLLAEHGVPLVPAVLVRDEVEARAAAASLGFPVAVKLSSSGVVHKSDLGGVVLDVGDEAAVEKAVAAVRASARKSGVDAADFAMSVSPMREGGVELLVSVRRDPAWGPMLTIGLGGIWVEVLDDTTLRPLPVDGTDVEEMLGELRAARVLEGGRGRPAVDCGALLDATLAIARAGESLGDALDTLEVNPLWAGTDGCEALDALVVWSDSVAPKRGSG